MRRQVTLFAVALHMVGATAALFATPDGSRLILLLLTAPEDGR